MSSIFPEKIAMYFASMNPLSAKIYADIQAVEESVKIDTNLSYNEKSKIIDKHLIYDVIRRNQRKQHQKQQYDDPYQHHHTSNKADGDIDSEDGREDIPVNEIFYNDPELDKDQVTALLTAVYPKKPEKYIYDDNSVYLDEHSEPFSYCTQSQAKYCDLEKLVKSLPLITSPPPPNCSTKLNSKSRPAPTSGSHSHREKQQAPLPTEMTKSRVRTSSINNDNDQHQKHYQKQHQHHGILNHEYIDEDLPTEKLKGHTQAVQLSSTKTKSGTSVLGISILGFGSGPNTSANDRKLKVKREPERNDDSEVMSDDPNLPNQVQNLDLIAELQAKLKLNKGKSKGSGLQLASSSKVNKPKAPPPPPPGKKFPGVAVQVCEPLLPASENPVSKGKPSDSAEVSKITKEATSTKKSKANGFMESESKTASTSNGSSSPKKMTTEEFTVDVSSPCRIATPKTGFDFLDNW